MMKRASLLMLCAAVGCSDEGSGRTDVTLHKLQNTGRGFMREIAVSHGTVGGVMNGPERPPDDGGMILPDPGGECPFYEYREEHTVVVDAEGNIVSETWSFCTRCIDADGTTIGEEVCVSEPVLPPDVICTEYSDEYTYCYECVDASGVVVDGACYPIDEPPPPPPDDCLARLCSVDPFCCEGGWDEICDEELRLCEAPPTEPTDPGCCESQVCELDPYCCEVAWDCRCDALAAEVCGGGGGGMEPPYPEPPVDDCFARFCEVAPSCCEMIWDETCDATLLEICGDGTGGGEPGDDGGMSRG
jgi:hypothetical protein